MAVLQLLKYFPLAPFWANIQKRAPEIPPARVIKLGHHTVARERMVSRGGKSTRWWRLAACAGLIAARVQALVTPTAFAPKHATSRRSTAMIASLPKRVAVAHATAEHAPRPVRRLLSVEEVTELARRTQQFERYRASEAALQEELGRPPQDAEAAARLGMAGGAREYQLRLRTCRRAKHILVQSNLRLVYSVAGRFTNRGLAYQDLVQVQGL